MKRRIAIITIILAMLLPLAACDSSGPTGGGIVPPAPASPSDTGTQTSPNTPADSPDPGAPAAPDEKFLIASYLQLSGSLPLPGNEAKRGLDLAIKHINANGGFNGAQVEITYYDTTGSAEEAVKIAQRIVADGVVDAVVGSVNSTEMVPTVPILNEAEIFHFGLGTSPAWMADQSMIWTFRASPNTGLAMPSNVEAVLSFGYETVAMLVANDDNSVASANLWQEAAEKKGLIITTRQVCDVNDTDFSGQIAQALATNPDCLFFALQGMNMPIGIRQTRMLYDGMIFNNESPAIEYQELAGFENCINIIFAFPYVDYQVIDDCNIPIMREYLERFQAEYGDMPVNNTAYRAWDTMMAMWEATKIAGSNDKAAMREAMHKVNIPGLGGQMDYTDGSRESYSIFNAFMTKSGKFTLLADWRAAGGYEEFLAATGRSK